MPCDTLFLLRCCASCSASRRAHPSSIHWSCYRRSSVTPISRRPACICGCLPMIFPRSRRRSMSFMTSLDHEAETQELQDRRGPRERPWPARRSGRQFCQRQRSARAKLRLLDPRAATNDGGGAGLRIPQSTGRQERADAVWHVQVPAPMVPLPRYDESAAAVASMADVDTSTLNAFIVWLNRRPIGKGSRHAIWSSFKQLVGWLQRHRSDLVHREVELPFNPFPRKNAEAQPRKPLSKSELTAVLTAARTDIDASWRTFEEG